MIESKYIDGTQVYGDDLDKQAIMEWYKAEEAGFYSIAHELSELYRDNTYSCFDELNYQLGYSFLKDRRFKHCLGIGCANGEELIPIAGQVDRFTAVEPAEGWWQDNIAGVPSLFIKPDVERIALQDGEVDLVTCFGALHHIPNISHTIKELARVTERGGVLLLREPIHTMGDWTKPRVGLTANERGFPPEWLASTIEAAGFRILKRSYCVFPVVPRLAKLLGQPGYGYNSRALTWLDRILSLAFAWNIHYNRNNPFKKVAPSAMQVFAVRI